MGGLLGLREHEAPCCLQMASIVAGNNPSQEPFCHWLFFSLFSFVCPHRHYAFWRQKPHKKLKRKNEYHFLILFPPLRSRIPIAQSSRLLVGFGVFSTCFLGGRGPPSPIPLVGATFNKSRRALLCLLIFLFNMRFSLADAKVTLVLR